MTLLSYFSQRCVLWSGLLPRSIHDILLSLQFSNFVLVPPPVQAPLLECEYPSQRGTCVVINYAPPASNTHTRTLHSPGSDMDANTYTHAHTHQEHCTHQAQTWTPTLTYMHTHNKNIALTRLRHGRQHSHTCTPRTLHSPGSDMDANTYTHAHTHQEFCTHQAQTWTPTLTHMLKHTRILYSPGSRHGRLASGALTLAM